ncbi:MAG: acetate--CoA ligase family protein [Desulfopila sp.]
MGNLDFLFNPKSVALIGASADTKKYGGWTAKNMVEHGFTGALYFVTRSKAETIFGVKTYPTILDIPGPVDLALVAVPIGACCATIEQCGQKGVRAAIVVTTGFGEAGEEGKKIERELVEMARKYNVRLMGPNCMGHFSAGVKLNTSIIELTSGPISLVLQSGNLAIDLNNETKTRKLGYSNWATIGNHKDLRFWEFIQHIKDDANTRVLMLYMEGLRIEGSADGRKFMEAARDAATKMPICALKIGHSQAGARAAASHTGSLAANDKVFDAALKQSGVIRIKESQDFLNVAEAFANCPLPKGNRIAIMTDGGGHGVMATDAAEAAGLEVPVLSQKTRENLQTVLPSYCPMRNPVDLAGPERDLWGFDHVTRMLLEDPDIDGLVIVGLLGGYADLSEEFAELELNVAESMVQRIKKSGKPVTMHSIYRNANPKCLQVFRDNGIPVYQSVEAAVMAMGKLHQYVTIKEKLTAQASAQPLAIPTTAAETAKTIFQRARAENRTVLLEHEARDILSAHGFAQPPYTLARSADEAVATWRSIGAPVAMKIVSAQIIHKSDAGGVQLNLNSEESIRAAFAEISEAARKYDATAEISGLLVMPMAAKGVECIIGALRDQTFGPTVMFGLGGIFVEVLKDVSFRVAPITLPTAHEMIEEINGCPILKGVRGQSGADVQSLALALQRLSQLMASEPEIAEIDLNPVFVHDSGLSLVDARMILHVKDK